MTHYSTCCHGNLRVEKRTEQFHGCDDCYELKVPYVVCSRCNEIQLTVSYETMKHLAR